jgi:hypothetical protein
MPYFPEFVMSIFVLLLVAERLVSLENVSRRIFPSGACLTISCANVKASSKEDAG